MRYEVGVGVGDADVHESWIRQPVHVDGIHRNLRLVQRFPRLPVEFIYVCKRIRTRADDFDHRLHFADGERKPRSRPDHGLAAGQSGAVLRDLLHGHHCDGDGVAAFARLYLLFLFALSLEYPRFFSDRSLASLPEKLPPPAVVPDGIFRNAAARALGSVVKSLTILIPCRVIAREKFAGRCYPGRTEYLRTSFLA